MAGIEADGIVDDGHGGDYARGHSHQLPADIAPRLTDVLRAHLVSASVALDGVCWPAGQRAA
jgi:hypothetical protein